jgi:hypothetical protein
MGRISPLIWQILEPAPGSSGGDGHLLDLGQYAGIPIVTVRDFFTGEFPELVD